MFQKQFIWVVVKINYWCYENIFVIIHDKSFPFPKICNRIMDSAEACEPCKIL